MIEKYCKLKTGTLQLKYWLLELSTITTLLKHSNSV